MRQNKTQEDTYNGIPLSAFENIVDSARPMIATKNAWHDKMDQLAILNRRRKTRRGNRIERNALLEEIKKAELEIQCLYVKMNEQIDIFCQACLDFRNLKW